MDTISKIRYTFAKKEKLVSRIDMDELFVSGESFIAYPLRVVYVLTDDADVEKQLASVLVSVGKKKFKRAVKRNRIKRLIREAYRLNKHPLLELLQQRSKRLDLAFIYLNNELPSYADIEASMLKTIRKLDERMEKG